MSDTEITVTAAVAPATIEGVPPGAGIVPPERAATHPPPSRFAAIGVPCMSNWGKLQIELIALMYVEALANSGDTWRRLTQAEVRGLLTDEQRRMGDGRYLRDGVPIYAEWFAMVDEALAAPSVADSVGGTWWWRAKRDA